MTYLLAIDPGGRKKKCTVAHFRDGHLERVSPSADAWTFRNPYADRVVIERPQQDGRSRAVPPAVLMDLSWQGALLAGVFVGAGAELREVSPDEWKGSVAKALDHKDRILPALTKLEQYVLDAEFPGFVEAVHAAVRHGALSRWAQHANGHYLPLSSRLPDVLDAVGLGLFDLGRIKK